MRTLRTWMITTALLTLVVLPAQGQIRGDFNGDGYADLAIGAPNESVGNIHAAGVVNVLYGSAGTGLRGFEDQLWHQDTTGIRGTAEANDAFGFSLASGDFNGDGYSDLAIGAVGETVNGVLNAGAVSVIYGSVNGLTAIGDQVFHQDTAGVEETAEDADNFAFSLAAGDFNRDGYDELAIGAPGENVPGLDPLVDPTTGLQLGDGMGGFLFASEFARAGAVHVLYGSVSGITTTGDELWYQEAQRPTVGSLATGIQGLAGHNDEFGYSLAVGDYNGDDADDLAIGARGDQALERLIVSPARVVTDVPKLPVRAGVVNVLFSNWFGLTGVGDQIWHQNVIDTQGIAERYDHFGTSLASGDFDRDTYDDLVVGVVPLNNLLDPPPDLGEDDLPNPDPPRFAPGAVHVFYGFHEGLIVKNDVLLHQGINGVLGNAKDDEGFGYGLATGDFNGDSYTDLAVGVPHDNIGRFHGAGGVNIFFGQREGLTVTGNQRWHQGIANIREDPGKWEQFGRSLAPGDFDGDGNCDLAIGVFNESVGRKNGAGAVNVIYGRSGVGLVAGRNQVWHQSKASILGLAEPADWFGFAVASGYR